MVITVQFLNSSDIKVWIFCSVIKSMLAVASSRMTILFFLKMALQMQIRDFSPDERFSPPSMTWKLNRSDELLSFSLSLFGLVAFEDLFDSLVVR